MMIKYAFSLAAIKFPSSLGGMFLLVAVLTAIGSEKAQHISKFFTPTLEWIAKWLPLFYIASLVTLPAGLKGVSGVCVCVKPDSQLGQPASQEECLIVLGQPAKRRA